MDLSRFSIDRALMASADADSTYLSVFYEKLLSGLFEKNENLFVKTDIQREREKIFIFPAFHWLTQQKTDPEKDKVLFWAGDDAAAEKAYRCAVELASTLPDKMRIARLSDETSGDDSIGAASLVFATAQSFLDALPSGTIVPRQFGFVVADQVETIAELPGETLRKILGHLLPSWERKTLVVAGKNTPKAKNFAWDFADNPQEMKLSEAIGYASTTQTVSHDVQEKDKIRFLLQLLSQGEGLHMCVFCNLKSTAIELSKRISMNGVASDYIAGNLTPDRKNQIVSRALAWKGAKNPARGAESEGTEPADATQPSLSAGAAESGGAAQLSLSASRFPEDSFVLVMTDDGAKGLNRPEFPVVVNHDIPLEPELYAERLNFLKRQDPSARLYNLVCERYMYGVPAIERLTDASLAIRPLDSETKLPEDFSEGKVIEMPAPRQRDRMGGRRSDGFPSRGGRNVDRADGRSDSRGRGVDRSTGMRRREMPHAERLEKARPEKTREREKPRVENMYAMSMEERMALYKKKYGKLLNQPGKEEASAKRRNGPYPTPHAQTQRGKGGGGPASGGGNSSGARANDEPTVQPGRPEVVESEKPRGFFGKLQDFFGPKKE